MTKRKFIMHEGNIPLTPEIKIGLGDLKMLLSFIPKKLGFYEECFYRNRIKDLADKVLAIEAYLLAEEGRQLLKNEEVKVGCITLTNKPNNIKRGK